MKNVLKFAAIAVIVAGSIACTDRGEDKNVPTSETPAVTATETTETSATTATTATEVPSTTTTQ